MYLPVNTHHTKQKGDTALAFIHYDLVKRGYFVFLPTSENAPYDLIVDCGELFRVQVKYREKGEIPKRSTWADKNGSHIKEIEVDDFDFFALVSGDKICYCPSEMKGSNVRFDLPNTATPFYWWEDFQILDKKPRDKRKLSDFGVKITRSYRPRLHKEKIQWPCDEKLDEMLEDGSIKSVAKLLGVSDTAVRKRIKNRENTRGS